MVAIADGDLSPSSPELNTAVEFDVEIEGETIKVLAEVAQQLGHGRVRAVCLKPTDGLRRGTAVRNTGRGLNVPVGDKTLGHVWNVWGDALDAEPGYSDGMERWDIHRPAPPGTLVGSDVRDGSR
jgi:F-type H+-transporting ATPase subunit beta